MKISTRYCKLQFCQWKQVLSIEVFLQSEGKYYTVSCRSANERKLSQLNSTDNESTVSTSNDSFLLMKIITGKFYKIIFSQGFQLWVNCFSCCLFSYWTRGLASAGSDVIGQPRGTTGNDYQIYKREKKEALPIRLFSFWTF
jgi:hypothetical protein